jgi:hypothetical protein
VPIQCGVLLDGSWMIMLSRGFIRAGVWSFGLQDINGEPIRPITVRGTVKFLYGREVQAAHACIQCKSKNTSRTVF